MQAQRKISVVGIIAGAIVGVAGGLISMNIFYIFIDIPYPAVGTIAPIGWGTSNPLVHLPSILAMSIFAILGGYTAATIAKHDEVLNGGLSSFLAILLAYCSTTTYTLYLEIITMVACPLFATLGGYLRLKQKRRKQAQQPGVDLDTDLQHRETQPEPIPSELGSKSAPGKGETYTLIRLGGIVLVIGVILSLWFGWSLSAFVVPGVVILLVYGIVRLIRRNSS